MTSTNPEKKKALSLLQDNESTLERKLQNYKEINNKKVHPPIPNGAVAATDAWERHIQLGFQHVHNLCEEYASAAHERHHHLELQYIRY